MRDLLWGTFADKPTPMGLQTYEAAVMVALSALPQQRWSFQRRTVSAMRAVPGGHVRLPLGALEHGGAGVALALGRLAFRGAEAVHRFDLRLPPAPGAEVVTVHDLPPLRFTDEGGLPPWSRATARRARAVIAPSAFAAEEIVDLLAVENVVVVPNGVDPTIARSLPLTAAERLEVGLRHPRYVLHAGGATARKNLNNLAHAWRLLAPFVPDCELVLVGPPDARRDRAFGGLPRVVRLGFRDHGFVGRLMASAACVVVPSLYEGFGLPALEAMSVGTPVVAAARGALPEVCGDAARLCEPSPGGLREALGDVLQDGGLVADLAALGPVRAAAFTWERSAAMHLEVYDRYL